MSRMLLPQNTLVMILHLQLQLLFVSLLVEKDRNCTELSQHGNPNFRRQNCLKLTSPHFPNLVQQLLWRQYRQQLPNSVPMWLAWRHFPKMFHDCTKQNQFNDRITIQFEPNLNTIYSNCFSHVHIFCLIVITMSHISMSQISSKYKIS